MPSSFQGMPSGLSATFVDQQRRHAGASLRNRINCVGEQPSRRAAALGSSSQANNDIDGLGQQRGKVVVPRVDVEPPATTPLPPKLAGRIRIASALLRIGRRIVKASSSRSRWSAARRFSPWVRRSDAWALIPVGRCVRITAVSTLLRFWPPGPPRRVARNSHCDSSTAGSRAAGWVRGVIEAGSWPERFATISQ